VFADKLSISRTAAASKFQYPLLRAKIHSAPPLLVKFNTRCCGLFYRRAAVKIKNEKCNF
jgi:hypothetical protein